MFTFHDPKLMRWVTAVNMSVVTVDLIEIVNTPVPISV